MDFSKRNLLIAFEDALNALDELGREPNRREQARLVSALHSLAAGNYSETAAKIYEFNRAIRRQSPSGMPNAVTKDRLRRCLTYLKSMPTIGPT
jgi:hypothetical protein